MAMVEQGEYSERENAILEDGYRRGIALEEIMRRLPGRSKSSIAGRAKRMGLTYKVYRRADALSLTVPIVAPAPTCQWFEGETLDVIDPEGHAPFCGKPSLPGRSYCGEHYPRTLRKKQSVDEEEDPEDPEDEAEAGRFAILSSGEG